MQGVPGSRGGAGGTLNLSSTQRTKRACSNLSPKQGRQDKRTLQAFYFLRKIGLAEDDKYRLVQMNQMN
ncbi:hypothetical protein Y1Q_0004428 [Alligator mississippiensis]|uniref:Uncharacterized protein n=1 Tax=Alligator mississippiensis TaxID=8496 RepID=A0A151MW99_ALLMI|nr:hypothetical protein Y1Q_0004428 [Alligator mississippiensis]